MYLYNLTLQRATGISHVIFGNFSGTKEQEIVVARGKILELLRPDAAGKLQSLYAVEVFGEIRSLVQFRLTGSSKDLIVVGSDSGRIVILEYNREKNLFDKIHQETYGKSGCRRIVPGQFLAVDPKGRAVMIAACEKQKFVYVLNRDSSARLTISSPLEAHKSQTLVFSVVGVDCGFDNPIFAAIELDYADADQDPSGQAAADAQKQLTFYELDLGLNHVVRKWAEPVDNGANLLVAVPGGADGPSGVLVCAENFVIYKNQGHPDVRAVIPRRADLPAERGVLIVAAATHKQKSMYFFLLQSEYGDVFRVTLEHDPKDTDRVTELKIKYFDTIPVGAGLCVLRAGFLFAASEFGNHALYRFQGIGDDEEVESSSATLMETDEGFQPVFFHPRRLKNLVQVSATPLVHVCSVILPFSILTLSLLPALPPLRHSPQIDEVESLMPLLDLKVSNLFDEETPQVFALCGRGPRSSLRILRPGLAVTEMAVTQLPGVPSAVWTVRKSAQDEFDAYIVVSFVNATLVLSIGDTVEEVSDSGFLDTTPSLAVSLLGEDSLMQESAVWTVRKSAQDEFDAYIVVSFINAPLVLSIGDTVEEVSDSGFLDTTPSLAVSFLGEDSLVQVSATLVLSIGDTVEEVSDGGFLDTTPSLAVSLLGEDSLMQVHPSGIRHIRADGRINEWKTPGKKSIVKVGCNRFQVVIALSGGELVHFEMDVRGQMVEMGKKDMPGDVACLDVAPIPEGRQRARFLAVGSYDSTVRILSLDPDENMQVLSVQAVSAPPESLLFLDVPTGPGTDGPSSTAAAASSSSAAAHMPSSLFLNAGLQNGVLLRTEVDKNSGQLSDSRTRFLGLRAPKLFGAQLRERRAMLCLSSRPWLGYSLLGSFHLTPLSYEALEYAAPFASDQCPEGIVAVAGETLRVFTVERLGEVFNQTVIPLRYTPRKAVLHPRYKNIVTIESDQGAFSAEEREELRKEAIEVTGAAERMEEERRERKEAARAARGARGEDGEEGMEEEEEEEEEEEDEKAKDPLPDEQFGYPKTVPSKWASCIRVINPKAGETTCLMELSDSEAAFSLCTVNFHADKTEGGAAAGQYLVVGTAKSLQFWPKRNLLGGFLHVYKFKGEDGRELELVHKTPVEGGVPTALCAFHGRLLVGVGNVLRIYDLGKKKLLRKCENKQFPHAIVSIHACGDRIYVGDVQEPAGEPAVRLADDVTPRWLTSALRIDFDTMAGGDKFGNVCLVRLPGEISEEIEEDQTGGRVKWDAVGGGRLNGAPNKLEQTSQSRLCRMSSLTHLPSFQPLPENPMICLPHQVIQFHVGDIVTAMQKTSLIPGGSECVIYSTMLGGVGALLPFVSREDVDFFSHLEMHLRQEHPPLAGREHVAYRSAYFPVKLLVSALKERYPRRCRFQLAASDWSSEGSAGHVVHLVSRLTGDSSPSSAHGARGGAEGEGIRGRARLLRGGQGRGGAGGERGSGGGMGGIRIVPGGGLGHVQIGGLPASGTVHLALSPIPRLPFPSIPLSTRACPTPPAQPPFRPSLLLSSLPPVCTHQIVSGVLSSIGLGALGAGGAWGTAMGGGMGVVLGGAWEEGEQGVGEWGGVEARQQVPVANVTIDIASHLGTPCVMRATQALRRPSPAAHGNAAHGAQTTDAAAATSDGGAGRDGGGRAEEEQAGEQRAGMEQGGGDAGERREGAEGAEGRGGGVPEHGSWGGSMGVAGLPLMMALGGMGPGGVGGLGHHGEEQEERGARQQQQQQQGAGHAGRRDALSTVDEYISRVEEPCRAAGALAPVGAAAASAVTDSREQQAHQKQEGQQDQQGREQEQEGEAGELEAVAEAAMREAVEGTGRGQRAQREQRRADYESEMQERRERQEGQGAGREERGQQEAQVQELQQREEQQEQSPQQQQQQQQQEQQEQAWFAGQQPLLQFPATVALVGGSGPFPTIVMRPQLLPGAGAGGRQGGWLHRQGGWLQGRGDGHTCRGVGVQAGGLEALLGGLGGLGGVLAGLGRLAGEGDGERSVDAGGQGGVVGGDGEDRDGLGALRRVLGGAGREGEARVVGNGGGAASRSVGGAEGCGAGGAMRSSQGGGTSAKERGKALSDAVAAGNLSLEESKEWERVMEADDVAQRHMAPQEGLSEAYLSGRSRRTGREVGGEGSMKPGARFIVDSQGVLQSAAGGCDT
ncbi:unnamed protein product, partial [Closterium sp. NIES-64]